ncbi:hypothetical protein [Mycobacterium syngnathidarum]
MVANQSPRRLAGCAGIIVGGLVAGLAVYVWLVFMLALAGFYTVSFGTAAVVGLFISAVLAVTSAIAERRRPPDEPPRRRLALFVRTMLVTHVLLCIYFVAFMPKTVAFLSHG